jgi:hypothetical protein
MLAVLDEFEDVLDVIRVVALGRFLNFNPRSEEVVDSLDSLLLVEGLLLNENPFDEGFVLLLSFSFSDVFDERCGSDC